MKKIYALALLFFILFQYSCSKEPTQSYDERIIGTWKISGVKGGNISNLPFTGGTFTFYANGSLDYLNAVNTTFKGSWDVIEKEVYNEIDNYNETIYSLQVFAIDFVNQQVLTQYYDEMEFTSTNSFRAKIISGSRTYETFFER